MKWQQRVRVATGLSCWQIMLHLLVVALLVMGWMSGTLVRVGEDDIYENGVIFHEMIVNIYEDMTPEGERRFLIEPGMPLDTALIGRDVAVTSHDKVVLAVEPLGAKI